MQDTSGRNQTPIKVRKLNFDPQNPRLPSHLNRGNQEDILDWMVKTAGILELMQSIGEQGYFSGEPLLVVQSADGNYTVVEGNRRLAAIKLLHEPHLTSFRRNTISTASNDAINRPDEIPCVIYDSRDDILEYLGFRHVTGIKSWGPLAKARYVRDLAEKHSKEPDDHVYRLVARSIGSRIDYVKRMLVGLKLYDIIADEDFYDITDLNEDRVSFSLITTALANSEIVKFLGLASAQDLEQRELKSSNVERLTRWMFEKRHDGRPLIGESRRLKDLNRVVSSQMALDQLIKGRTLDEALIYTSAPIDSFRELLYNARDSILDAQRQLHLIQHGLEESDQTVISNIFRLTRDISNLLRGRLEETRDNSGFEE